VSHEQVYVDWALGRKENGELRTPYGRNGPQGIVNIDEEGDCWDGIQTLNVQHKKCKFFLTYFCSCNRTCVFEARVPVDAPLGQCPAIFFNEHVRQWVIFQRIFY
jgi:hypothetical protein